MKPSSSDLPAGPRSAHPAATVRRERWTCVVVPAIGATPVALFGAQLWDASPSADASIDARHDLGPAIVPFGRSVRSRDDRRCRISHIWRICQLSDRRGLLL